VKKGPTQLCFSGLEQGYLGGGGGGGGGSWLAKIPVGIEFPRVGERKMACLNHIIS
jgi:hypothetical protein